MKGMCVEKGQTVQFNTVQNEKGHQAQDVNVVVPPDQASYFGEIKSFNPMKGRLDQDGGHGPAGSQVKFKVVMEAKGYAAKEVMVLGEQGKQIAMMSKPLDRAPCRWIGSGDSGCLADLAAMLGDFLIWVLTLGPVWMILKNMNTVSEFARPVKKAKINSTGVALTGSDRGEKVGFHAVPRGGRAVAMHGHVDHRIRSSTTGLGPEVKKGQCPHG
eukprot:Skav226033  [mRNA]  locus=scaffold2502:88696:93259:- [translate_table: standard]